LKHYLGKALLSTKYSCALRIHIQKQLKVRIKLKK